MSKKNLFLCAIFIVEILTLICVSLDNEPVTFKQLTMVCLLILVVIEFMGVLSEFIDRIKQIDSRVKVLENGKEN